jgi:hypothetical protein
MEQFGKNKNEVIARLNAARDWLKHNTPHLQGSMEVTNYDAGTMIVRAVTKIEAEVPGSETPTIAGFIDFSHKHYSAILGRRLRRSATNAASWMVIVGWDLLAKIRGDDRR